MKDPDNNLPPPDNNLPEPGSEPIAKQDPVPAEGDAPLEEEVSNDDLAGDGEANNDAPDEGPDDDKNND